MRIPLTGPMSAGEGDRSPRSADRPGGPVFHQSPPELEQVRAGVGRLIPVLQRMGRAVSHSSCEIGCALGTPDPE